MLGVSLPARVRLGAPVLGGLVFGGLIIVGGAAGVVPFPFFGITLGFPTYICVVLPIVIKALPGVTRIQMWQEHDNL